MEQYQIDRINELSKKSKAVGLTEEEKLEQESLRRAYIESFKKNIRSTLDNVYIVDEKGNKKKIERKNSL